MDEMNPQSPKTLAAVGELRTGQFTQLFSERENLEVLTSAPGLGPLSEKGQDVYQNPSGRFSMLQSKEMRSRILENFARDIDSLTKGSEWGGRLAAWARSLRASGVKFRFWDQSPLYSRVISRPKKSLVLAEPIHDDLDNVDHELRLSVEGEEHERIRMWFSERFENSQDITEEVLACIDESWAGGLLSPKDAYHKVLAAYFDEVLDSLDRDFDTNPMLAHLTEFQVEAYHYAKFILKRYGGVFLADVVGLGKTYTAVALLLYLKETYNEHAVIVAPPKILHAWRELAREHRIEVGLVSLGKLSDLENYTDREILVVDESHNLRNDQTNRYAEIAEWARPGGEAATRKVILLSATPQNNSVNDIRSQLRLFPDSFSPLPLKAESLDDWCKDVRKGNRSASELLQHVVVRRTRRYIKEAFPDATLKRKSEDGSLVAEKIRFPVRVSGSDQCLRYSLTETYHGGIYERLLAILASLNFPLHSLGSYLTEQGAEDPSTQGIRRSGNTVRGLFKVLLLKRLESSAHAFQISVERLEAKLIRAVESMGQGRVLLSEDWIDIEDEDEAPDFHGKGIDIGLFEEKRLRKNVRQDLIDVRGLLTLVDGLNAETDAKIQRLFTFLERRSPSEHKTIIFTQFGDTAEYLVDALSKRHESVELVTGGVSGVMKKAHRFSPKSNRYELGESESEVDLLVSTDVLSEGVNLQDADTLINYDLHWNPVRLIQRAGRIDRIGSEHEVIEIASFLPERELEAGLRLEEVLRRRIREFIAIFGEDSEILPADATPQEEDMLRAYSGEAINQEPEDDELDGLSRHQEKLLRLRKDSPEEYARILQLRPGRFSQAENASEVAAARVGSFWFFWGLRGGESRPLSAKAALDSLLADSEKDSVVNTSQAAWQKLGKIEQRFLQEAATLRAQQMRPRLSPALVALLGGLETFLDHCSEIERPLVEGTIAWTRERAGHPTVERTAHTWRKLHGTPLAAFTNCRKLHGKVTAPSVELGKPTIVAASFNAE